MEDTYDHTRWMPPVGNYNGRNRRSGADRTLPMRNRPYQFGNCDVGYQEDETQYNRDYNDGELDNLGYDGGHSAGHVLLTENGDNSASIELET